MIAVLAGQEYNENCMGKRDDTEIVHRSVTPPRKPPRLEGVVQNRGIKNVKKPKKLKLKV
jgi:hypothetical protein